MVDDLLLDLAAVGGLDEVHVLQQVRHAGLAVAFVARADQVRHVDRDLGVGGVGIEQHAQAVGEDILGDAADGGLLFNTWGKRLGESGGTDKEGEACCG